jgi:hypothetical protein
VTSLIYIAIIVLWIAVLVPMWLRRLDRVSESKSTEKFSSAMELLGTKVTAETAVTSGAAARDPKPPVTPRLAAERARKAAEMRAAAAARRASIRRSIVLAVLASALMATLILAVVRTIAQWVPVATAAMVIAFVVASALTASTRAESLSARAADTGAELRAELRSRDRESGLDGESWEPIAQDSPIRRRAPRTTSSRPGSPRAATVAIEVERPRERTRIIAPPELDDLESSPADVRPPARARQTVDLTRDDTARDDGRSDTEAIPVIDEAYVASRRASNE